jgi:hypothetical protein
MFYCGFGLIYCVLPTVLVGLSVFFSMNNLQNTTFGFIYSILQIILYGVTAISGVICDNPPKKFAKYNLQKLIGCSIGIAGMVQALVQLSNYRGAILDVLQIILTWLSIIFLLRIFCDALNRRGLGSIKNKKIIMI